MPKVKKSPARSVGKKNLTIEHNSEDKVVKVPERDFVFFFIGGAADKYRYYLIPETKIMYHTSLNFIREIGDHGYKSKVTSEKVIYLGYNEIKGEDDIQNNVIPFIASNDSLIYLIGHSLGGWNAAHLSRILTKSGYSIEYLVTLDPVGEGIGVSLISDIYWHKPEPLFNDRNWINIRAEEPWKDYSVDDFIADLGDQWDVDSGPQINETLQLTHGAAFEMFSAKVQDNKSAMEFIIDNFSKHIKPEENKLPNVEI